MNEVSVTQLRRAIEIKEQLEQLNAELESILSGSSSTSNENNGEAPTKRGRRPGKRKGMSAAGRARIAQAARQRWAKAKRSGKNSL